MDEISPRGTVQGDFSSEDRCSSCKKKNLEGKVLEVGLDFLIIMFAAMRGFASKALT